MAPQAAGLGAQKPFPFMKLPAEIRLTIYELTIHDMMRHITSSIVPLSPGVWQLRTRGTPALLLTSKTIRAESGKALLPLVSAYFELFKDFVSELELNKLVAQEELTILQRVSGARVTSVEEMNVTVAQITRQLDKSTTGLRATTVVHLALQRAADDSLL
jgi:hypothetical protein